MDLNLLIERQYFLNSANFNKLSAFDGCVQNLSCRSEDEYIIEGEMGMPLPPFVAKFNKEQLNGNLLGVADEDGHVKLIDTRKSKDFSLIKEWSAHSNAVFDITWVSNDAKMATASGDQTARLWDVEKMETVAIFRGHTCSLKSVAVQPLSRSVYLTGARDGNIMLWDTRCYMKNGFCSAINTIKNAHALPPKEVPPWSSGKKRKSRRNSGMNQDSKTSVTSTIFQDGNTVISSGACDGAIKFWDIRKNYTHHVNDPIAIHTIQFPGKGPRKHGYTSLVLNSTSSRLYAVCTNDIVYEYSATNLSTKPISIYEGSLASSFYVKAALSPDDRYLLCGSSDAHAYIWKTKHPDTPPFQLKGHHGEVTSVAWCPLDGDKIVTCSDDNTFRIWRLFNNEEEKTGKCERKTISKDEEFKTDTLIEKWFCPSLQICTNKRAQAKWTFDSRVNKIVDELPAICKTPVVNKNEGASSSSSTKVTPIRSENSPQLTLRQKKLTPQQQPSVASSTSCTSTTPKRLRTSGGSPPQTPRTSRLFMESWLHSPRTYETIPEEQGGEESLVTKLPHTPITAEQPLKRITNNSAEKKKRSPKASSQNIKALLVGSKRKRDSNGEKENSKMFKLMESIDEEETEPKDLLDHAENTSS